jgi:hypothetical protein
VGSDHSAVVDGAAVPSGDVGAVVVGTSVVADTSDWSSSDK